MAGQLIFQLEPGGSLNGSVRVAGDKSISHRAIMLGAIAQGLTRISGFLQAEDALATLSAFKALGVHIEGPNEGDVAIHGVGLHGLVAPSKPLDLGNSGTSMRLMAGLLAGQTFDSELIGDQYLSKRPMVRVTGPLGQMGAVIEVEQGGTSPLKITGGRRLVAIKYRTPVASAQIKSCLLLAGLYATGKTCVIEQSPSRDHTERMLTGFSYLVRSENNCICLNGGGKLLATDIDVPADISSAAFFMVGASIASESDITLRHVGLNPTRTGVIDILQLMGASIKVMSECVVGGEPVADIRVCSAQLRGIRIPEKLVPLAIDEFPVLFVAAACAEGETVLTGAQELRIKESDRLGVMADGLSVLGIDARATVDGMVIRGGQINGGCINSHGDHRIAMAFSIAALAARDPIEILDCTNVDTSFPGFVSMARKLGLKIHSRIGDSP